MSVRWLVVTLLVATPAWSGGATYELRGERLFDNEIDGHRCKQLYIGNREVGWIFGTTETDIGLIGRICKEEAAPFEGAADPGTTYGGVLDGWYVIDIKTRKASQLSLPTLNNFSNPSFCGRRAAYWGVSEGTHYSLVIADLSNKSILKAVPVGELALETDYMYHLAPATWSKNCSAATFADERYIKHTVIHAKSN